LLTLDSVVFTKPATVLPYARLAVIRPLFDNHPQSKTTRKPIQFVADIDILLINRGGVAHDGHPDSKRGRLGDNKGKDGGFEFATFLLRSNINRYEGDPMSIKVDAPAETVADRFLFATVLLWSFLGMCFPLYDTDFWWHLKTGQWILEGNGIPYVDLYTFTDSDKPWIDLHWGFQVLVAILYRLGGVPLVTLVKSAVITGGVAVAWRAGGVNLPAWKKAALWLLPIICIVGRGNERPEMLSQLFLAMWLWINLVSAAATGPLGELSCSFRARPCRGILLHD
jgi:hypothetical protein